MGKGIGLEVTASTTRPFKYPDCAHIEFEQRKNPAKNARMK
jgi:hypothetical protein